MNATVYLKDYMWHKGEPHKGMRLTYTHSDTGEPVPVSYIEKVDDKTIKVMREDPQFRREWSVDIWSLTVQIVV